MVKKKNKIPKKGRKRSLKEDVHATTSLPPSVEGQLRCFLRVSVSKIVWLCAKPPDTTHVRLRWWGEITEGSVFRPLDVKNPQKTATRTVARYPVRCGPKQFAAYLTDMGSLILDVLKGASLQPIGKAQINEIGHLAPQVPINGFYSVFSTKSADKIAELHVSLVFEPLPASYDSSGSIPTTDLSVATAGTGTTAESSSIQSQLVRTGPPLPVPRPHRVISSSSEDPFMSPIPKVPHHSRHSEPKQIITPRGLDTDYSFVVGPGKVDDLSVHQKKEKTATQADPGLGTAPVLAPHQHRADHCSDTDHARPAANELQTLIGMQTDRHIEAPVPTVQRRLNPSSHPGSDLISALLDRGTKLRDNMIKSELDPGTSAVKGTPDGITPGMTQMRAADILSGPVETRPFKRRSSGELFREILRTDDAHQPVLPAHTQEMQSGHDNGNMETQTIELLMGEKLTTQELNELKTLQSELSPQSSVSSESDAVMSETEDPLRDQSILEELFYKGGRSSSESSLSDLLSSDEEVNTSKPTETSSRRRRRRWSYESSLSDPGNQRPPSRKDIKPSSDDAPVNHPEADQTVSEETEGRKTERKRSQERVGRLRQHRGSQGTSEATSSESEAGSTSRMSEGSRVSFQEPLIAEKKINPSDGLSVQRLTLLGRVHIARVMIDSLTLKAPLTPGISRQDQRPSRGGKSRGRPPRPSQNLKAKKCTYFVEYYFPVAASPRQKSLVTSMATEVMRLVSKKVENNGEVTFGHRSVFPVAFDGSVVDCWWKQLLVFKIFSRSAGQKTPVLLGVASLPLRSVLQSPDLALLNLVLDARDKQQTSTSAESSADGTLSDTIIGTLKMSIELASDSKDFPMALARMKVAEMKGAQIVPLPSNKPYLPIKIPTGSVEDSDTKSSSRSIQTDDVSTQGIDGASVGVDRAPASSRTRTETERSDTKARLHHPDKEPTRELSQKHKEPDREQRRGKQLDSKHQDDGLTSETKPDYEARTLHSLLLIPEGRSVTVHGIPPLKPSSSSIPHVPAPQPHSGTGHGISGFAYGRDQTTRNTYLVCRLFWSDDSVRSNVCWGTTEPVYNFMQVSPVLLTPSLLERARNNCMVIEVWDKKTSAQNDQLVGIAKLPMHQFYMSFRDERIARTLLKSQYPVAAVDNYVNIVDPFTGIQYGQLKVLLALGSSEQISSLQRLKCDMDHMDTIPQRPGHYLERGEAVVQNAAEQQPSENEQVEHLFEVVVEGIRGLPQLEDTVWGEADCFVQYHFPSQSQPKAKVDGVTPMSSVGPVLMPHQTLTTLCMPDPTFHDVARHRLQLPRGTPVQRELLTACAGVGGGAGGLPFEVWCRYYYPNIRDQVVAKASLPLAKLCGMVTMQRRGEPSIQTFSLPLRLLNPVQETLTMEQIAKIPDAGLLDVTVNYQHKVVQASRSSPGMRDIGGPQVCLSVSILRACGLKHAAKSLAKSDSSLQYPSEVGVNAYVKMSLTFLSKEDVRITQTVARTFAPEFSHHVDFPCPLLFDETESDHLSLAEALETAEMKLQVWHQVPAFKSGHDVNFVPGTGMSARRLYAPTGDILLATTTIPLHSLLSHNTGIQGWYPITLPSPEWSGHQPSTDPSSASPRQDRFSGLERVAGGLELAIKFAHEGDRSRVIDAGRRVGWSPDTEHEIMDDLWNDEDVTTGSYSADINIHVDSACFPVHTALRPSQHALDTAAKAYIRYKLYDRGSVCSKLCYLDVNEDNYITANLRHTEHIHTALTQSLAWYLREESLEIQLWLSYSRELSSTDTGRERPRQRDKLIGCAYMDMSALCDKRVKQHRISGLYPVFRPGASDLGGSCIRAHLSLNPTYGHHPQEDLSEEEADPHTRPVHPSTHRQRPKFPPRHPSKTQEETWDSEETGRTSEDAKRQQEEEDEAVKQKKSLEPVLMTVAVERAMHLATVRCNHKLEDCLPSCYVTFQTAGGSPVYTATIASTDQPVWGFEQEVRISSQVLDRQSFIFKVWHQTSSQPDMNSDRMLGFASVDLAPLLAGFRSLNGWYNILDFSGHCKGQIKVSITPRESVSPLKHSPKAKTTPNTSAIFAQAFPNVPLTTSPRQISSQPQQPSKEAPTHPPSNHYQEHLQNVRKFHADLHDRLRARQLDSTTAEQGRDGERGIRIPEVGLPSTVSGSFLMQNLRRNLEELEVVQQGLQQKLASQDQRRVVPAQHETRQSNEPSREYREKTHSSDIAESSSRHLEHDDTDPTGGAPGEEDILQRVRDELQQADAEYQPINADHEESDGPLGSHDPGSDDAAPSPMLESDWEDSMQFQYGKADEGSDREADIILPRPLNDVSSAYFSNGIRPDAILTIGTREPDRELHESGWHKATDDTSTRHKPDDEADSRSKTESKDTSDGRNDSHDLNYRRSESEKPPMESDNGMAIDGGSPMESNLDRYRPGNDDGLIGDVLPEGDDHGTSSRSTEISEGSLAYDDQMTDRNETHSNKKKGSHNQRVMSDLCTDQSLETEHEQEGADQAHASQIDQDEDLNNQAEPSFSRTDPSSEWEPEADRFLGQESESRTEPGKDEVDVGSPRSSSDESVVITIDSRQAEKQSRARTASQPPSAQVHQPLHKSTPAQLPNFFLPAQDLEASMRALHNITSVLPRAQPIQILENDDKTAKPTPAARELTGRLASKQPSARPQVRRLPQKPAFKLPTAEEAKRIAKIFSSKYTES